jgi:steroid 5-alpha reductase family enzyme
MSLFILLIAVAAQWAALDLIMSGAWVVQQRTGNAGYIDAIWTFGLGVVGTISALVPLAGAATSGRQWLVAAIMLAWSLRLGVHILQRSAARGDDPRYAALIKQWGANARGEMRKLLHKQALVSVPLALGIFVAAHNPSALFHTQDVLALLVLLAALAGEGIADRQLRVFVASGKGGICDRGLWRWSRHPNYFFEWQFWVAFPLLAIDVSGYPAGFLALAAPAFMYWLLVYVSGIPPLEAHMVAKHGEAYRAFQARTSAFFPLPSKEAG